MVWEPVLPTDLGAPSTATLRRASDPRVSQYWDKEHIVSRLLGEHDRASLVWDYVAVYRAGTIWETAPPQPAYSGRPVVRSIDGTREAIRRVLSELTAPWTHRNLESSDFIWSRSGRIVGIEASLVMASRGPITVSTAQVKESDRIKAKLNAR